MINYQSYRRYYLCLITGLFLQKIRQRFPSGLNPPSTTAHYYGVGISEITYDKNEVENAKYSASKEDSKSLKGKIEIQRLRILQHTSVVESAFCYRGR